MSIMGRCEIDVAQISITTSVIVKNFVYYYIYIYILLLITVKCYRKIEGGGNVDIIVTRYDQKSKIK